MHQGFCAERTSAGGGQPWFLPRACQRLTGILITESGRRPSAVVVCAKRGRIGRVQTLADLVSIRNASGCVCALDSGNTRQYFDSGISWNSGKIQTSEKNSANSGKIPLQFSEHFANFATIINFPQILEGSFSVVSKPIFASTHSFCSILLFFKTCKLYTILHQDSNLRIAPNFLSKFHYLSTFFVR